MLQNGNSYRLLGFCIDIKVILEVWGDTNRIANDAVFRRLQLMAGLSGSDISQLPKAIFPGWSSQLEEPIIVSSSISSIGGTSVSSACLTMS